MFLFALTLALALTSHPALAAHGYSDDPADWPVDTSIEYKPVLSDPLWLAPAMASNNNVAIEFHGDRLFVAWRSAPIHFASKKTKLLVVSSADGGRTWQPDHEVAMGSDIREGNLVELGGKLHLYWFQAGTNPTKFEPRAVFHSVRLGDGSNGGGVWSEPEKLFGEHVVVWDFKVRGGRMYMTGYQGGHYDLSKKSDVEVFFKVSDDGVHWRPVDPARPVQYVGGVSEVGFEFDENGDFWGVLRNEDGDDTGFGSMIAYAPANDLGNWQLPSRSNPYRYDSPKLFRHGKDIYAVARRNPDGVYDHGMSWLPLAVRKVLFLVKYSFQNKRTALYKLDRSTRSLVALRDLPSAGDTAFPSVRRMGPDLFLVANYTSPLDLPGHSWLKWIEGQISPNGTRLYLQKIRFVPQGDFEP